MKLDMLILMSIIGALVQMFFPALVLENMFPVAGKELNLDKYVNIKGIEIKATTVLSSLYSCLICASRKSLYHVMKFNCKFECQVYDFYKLMKS